jgi:hypothetical protein
LAERETPQNLTESAISCTGTKNPQMRFSERREGRCSKLTLVHQHSSHLNVPGVIHSKKIIRAAAAAKSVSRSIIRKPPFR